MLSFAPITALARKLGRGCAALARDCEGGAMIEYAFVGPPFIALLLANFHTALVFFVQESLDTAVEDAVRLVQTGQAQTYLGTNSQGQNYYGMTAADFRKALCGQISGIPKILPPVLTCDTSKLFVDLSTPNVASISAVSASSQLPPNFTYDTNGNVTNTFSYSSGSSGQIAQEPSKTWPFVR